MIHTWLLEFYLDEEEIDVVSDLIDSDDFTNAIPILETKIHEMEANGVSEPEILADIAYLYYLNGESDNASVSYEKAIAAFEESEFSGSVGFGGFLQEYAVLLKAKNKHELALNYFLRTKEIFNNHWVEDDNPVCFAELLGELADIYYDLKQYDLATESYASAKKILEDAEETEHFLYAAILNNLGEIFLDLKRNDEALPLFTAALILLENKFSDENGVIDVVKSNLVKLNNQARTNTHTINTHN
jgi:tetratricopeptide (TPR) repeat protein